MRIFLTGATGYIGSVITEKLQAAGHQVLGLACSDASASTLQARDVEVVRGDLTDLATLTAAAQDADAVIHAAFDAQDFAGSVQRDTAAIRAIISALQGSGKPLILTSGTALLGDTGSAVFDEHTSIPTFPADADPGLTVLADRFQTEQEVLNAPGMRGIVLRPPNVYGRSNGQSLLNVLKTVGQRSGAVPYLAGTADHQWSFVHVDDLADLFVLAIERAQGGELFHASGEAGLRTGAIAEALGQAIGQDGKTVELDFLALTEALGMAQLAAYWSSNSQSSSHKARTVLGWTPKHTHMLQEIAQEQAR